MRYLMTFSYDGSKYYGYQKQKDKKTVQQNIEENITKINNEITHISSSGRTDRGVHALNQKAHFDLKEEIEPNKLKSSLNKMINKDIYIKDIIVVDSQFHARYNVQEKEYIYKINVGEYDPILKDYIYQLNKELNFKEIKKALKVFEGTHNFKSFTKVDEEKESYVRTIKKTSLKIENNIITISFIGTGFLRYMVRNMVGFLIEVGLNKRKANTLTKILEKEDRRESGIIAPPVGLYLKDVKY